MNTATKLDLTRTAHVRRVCRVIVAKQGVDGKPSTRFGEKLFISAVWNALVDDGQADFDTLSVFKHWLLQSMLRADDSGTTLMVLARADLVAAMDHEAVVTSELTDRGATFHFLLDIELAPECYGRTTRSQSRITHR